MKRLKKGGAKRTKTLKYLTDGRKFINIHWMDNLSTYSNLWVNVEKMDTATAMLVNVVEVDATKHTKVSVGVICLYNKKSAYSYALKIMLQAPIGIGR